MEQNRILMANTGRVILLDQTVSSLGNVALTLIVAKVASVGDFGAYALAIGIYQFVLMAGRALVCEPLLIACSGSLQLTDKLSGRSASLLLGSVAGWILVVLGAIGVGSSSGTLCVLGLSLPLLMVQDLLRYESFCSGRPWRAVFNDGIWLTIQLLGTAAVVLSDHKSASVLLAIWGASGALPALAFTYGTWRRFQVRRAVLWFRTTKSMGRPYLVEAVATTGIFQVVTWELALFGSLQSVGALRYAQVLFGPFNIAQSAARAHLMSTKATSTKSDQRGARRMMALLAALCFASGIILFTLPVNFMVSILGPTWRDARLIILLVAAQKAIELAGLTKNVQLRIAQLARYLAAARIAAGFGAVALTLLLAPTWKEQGAAWGLLASSAAAYLASSYRVRRIGKPLTSTPSEITAV